jgi:DNA-binding GntR family transcriptional regulator
MLREVLNGGRLEEGARRKLAVATRNAEVGREIVLIRDSLERLAAREAATKMDESDLDQLRRIMNRA